MLMKMKRFLGVLLAFCMAMACFALPASADTLDTTRDVTLTIYALEANDAGEVTLDSSVTGEKLTISGRTPIEGVSFYLYKVDDAETSYTVPADVTPIETAATGSDGATTVTIPASEQGRYLVVQASAPDYTVGTTIPFLVDLPTYNDGTYLYDVYAYPKQVTTGAVKLTKTFGGTAPQNGETATFTLTDASGNTSTYTTDENGILAINDLDYGTYTLAETATADGYEMSTETLTFTISTGGCVLSDGTTVGTVVELTVDNPAEYTEPEPEPEPTTDTSTDTDPEYEPNVTKEVSGDGGKTYGDTVNIDAYNGGVATWKITANVPVNIVKYDVFTLEDPLADILIAPTVDNVRVVDEDGNAIPASAYTVTVEGQLITVTFVPTELADYAGANICVIFDTAINLDEYSYATLIENQATLTHTLVQAGENTTDTDGSGSSTDVDTDGSSSDTDTTSSTVTITTAIVTVWTGKIHGYKHDADDNPLKGAEFTLYADADCTEVLGTATSDKNGEFTFEGLLDGTYYVVETAAPTGYQADTSIMEVTVALGTTGEAVVELDVLNIPKTKLPNTGGVGVIGLMMFGGTAAIVGAVFIVKAIMLRRRNKAAGAV